MSNIQRKNAPISARNARNQKFPAPQSKEIPQTEIKHRKKGII